MKSFKNPLPKFFSSVGKGIQGSVSDSAAPMWIGATVIFAVLFFMSSILDMKIHVSFGQTAAGTTSVYQTTTPTVQTAAPASGGIASQVGGC